MVNCSGKWLLLGAGGEVVEGYGNPEGRLILAAPGCEVAADVVAKYRLEKRLMAPTKPDANPSPNPAPGTPPADTKMVRPGGTIEDKMVRPGSGPADEKRPAAGGAGNPGNPGNQGNQGGVRPADQAGARPRPEVK